MQKPAAIAILLVLICLPAFAVERAKAEKVKNDCEIWIRTQPPENLRGDTQQEKLENLIHANACTFFVKGVIDEMYDSPYWLDDTHKKVVIGHWQDAVSVGQAARVFVEYIEANPAQLNKPANVVIRQSAEAANLYTYTAP